ncbi:hypothetical protein C8R45DRAFT_1031323 [Mycena sanguinolenta]|nr:hypothetical protein C8R45DRAFT_1031323 [Mycena sanguinolenta]
MIQRQEANSPLFRSLVSHRGEEGRGRLLQPQSPRTPLPFFQLPYPRLRRLHVDRLILQPAPRTRLRAQFGGEVRLARGSCVEFGPGSAACHDGQSRGRRPCPCPRPRKGWPTSRRWCASAVGGGLREENGEFDEEGGGKEEEEEDDVRRELHRVAFAWCGYRYRHPHPSFVVVSAAPALPIAPTLLAAPLSAHEKPAHEEHAEDEGDDGERDADDEAERGSLLVFANAGGAKARGEPGEIPAFLYYIRI